MTSGPTLSCPALHTRLGFSPPQFHHKPSHEISPALCGNHNCFKPDFGFDEVNINIKAWDNANNPSEAQIKLDVTESDIFELKNVYNFPNPFYDKTQFTFEITQSAEISIDTYTLSGLKVNSIFPKYFEEGYGIIDWDGTDQFGQILSNGVYLFQMKAKNNLKKINFTGRIAILR